MHTGFSYETMKERNHLEGLGTDGSIIFKQILKKQGQRAWDGFIWLRLGTSGGPCEKAMNVQVTQNMGNLISSVLLASLGVLFSEVSKQTSKQASSQLKSGHTTVLP
jgi:hypothetical protein